MMEQGIPQTVLALAKHLGVSESAARQIYDLSLMYGFERGADEAKWQMMQLLEGHLARAERQLQHDIGAYGDNEDAQHAHGLVDALEYLASNLDPESECESPYTKCQAPPSRPGHPHRCTP